jgi:hypothetical protein
MSVVPRALVVILLLTAQFLMPCSIKRMNGVCRCGCSEFMCYCCRGAESSNRLDAFSACRCKSENESFELSPFLPLHLFDGLWILTRSGTPLSKICGMPLPGFYEPPVRPPPLS